MSGSSRRAALLGTATLLIVLLALFEGVGARGGGGGGGRGGGRGGGGYNRGGGGMNRGGPAAGGSFAPTQPRVDPGQYNRRGPAADGNLDLQRREQLPQLDRGDRQERREERRDEREERRDDWQESIEDGYDDDYDYGGGYYGGGYYGGDYEDYDEEPLVYYTLSCNQPTVTSFGGAIYYVCGSNWYVRIYFEGDVVYTLVENPTGH